MNYTTAKQKLTNYCKNNNINTTEINAIIQEVLNKSLLDFIKTNKICFLDYVKIKTALVKRKNGVPLSHIVKHKYFFGNKFYVNKNVLTPRPETELLVEEGLKYAFSGAKILDLCCGSGCIGISINKALGDKNLKSTVSCLDISKKALKVALKNAKRLNAQVEFIQSDLFDNVNEKFDIIISNPPYIKSEDILSLDTEVKKYDPLLALDGGVSGYDFYEKIINSCKNYLTNNGVILFEVGQGQGEFVSSLLEQQGFETQIINDYSNINRIVVGKLSNR